MCHIVTDILSISATSFERSTVYPLSSLVSALPEEYYEMLPFAMTPLIGTLLFKLTRDSFSVKCLKMTKNCLIMPSYNINSLQVIM